MVTNGNTTDGSNVGGRILRITPTGVVTVFAAGFKTSGAQDSSSFADSELSISFSADGTTLYASDDSGIWQFKTTASLADSTSGSLVGLSDLRTLGVPYDGLGTAVAVVDTGVDANSAPFRGRIAPGTNIVTGGLGNQDLAPTQSSTTGTGSVNGAGAGTTTGIGGGSTFVSNGFDGHGTLVAGVVAQFVPQTTIQPVDIFNPYQTLAGSSTSATGGAGGVGGVGGVGGGVGGVSLLSFNSNAFTTSQNVYDGMKYVADHPYVNDPVRPGQVDRVIASTYGWGSSTTFTSEGMAYRKFPQLVIALKNQLRRYRALGIAPVAAAGQFGSPLLDFGPPLSGATGGLGGVGGAAGGVGGVGGTTGTTGLGANNAANPNVGDSNGMSLPATLNEVISVTGVVSFPFTLTPGTPPTDPPTTTTPNPIPVLLIAGSTGTTGTTTTTTSTPGNPISLLLAGNSPPNASAATGNGATGTTAGATNSIDGIPSGMFVDEVLAAANRSVTTDYAAPAVNIPTFRRTFNPATASTSTTTTSTTTTTDPADHLAFTEGGTSLSAGIVAGSYAMVSSALNYWTSLNQTGVTSDAYLNTPMGTTTLNFGAGALKDVSMYNNPDGINAILAWTSVPVTDANNGLTQSQPPYSIGTSNFRNISRISVGNAIASIEGTVAIQYLLDHNDFPIIDANHDGNITATELQNFEDNATQMGMPEAGAMARLLGGTDTTPAVGPNAYGEQPDQAGALQRRFNYFDYSADGQLNGSVSITQFKMLAHTLLPNPTAFVINDRQRASANSYLIAPGTPRNYKDLQHLLPRFEFVPKSALLKYRNISPDRFGVNRQVRNTTIAGQQYPVWALFNNTSGNSVSNVAKAKAAAASTTAASTTTKAAAATTTGNTTTSNTSTTASTTNPSINPASMNTSASTTAATNNANANAVASTPSSTNSSSTTSSSSDTTSTTSSTQQTLAQKIASLLINPNGTGSSGSNGSTGSSSGSSGS